MSNSTENALAVINVLLATLRAASTFGINYRKVADMQAVADAENRPLSDAELRIMLDEAQRAIDDL